MQQLTNWIKSLTHHAAETKKFQPPLSSVDHILQEGASRTNYDFVKGCSAVTARLAQWQLRWPTDVHGVPIGILITPWLLTAVPFYCLEIACALRESGRAVTLLVDFEDLFLEHINHSKEEQLHLSTVLDAYAKLFPVVSVSDYKGKCTSSLNYSDCRFVENMLFENAILLFRGEEPAIRFTQDNLVLKQHWLEHYQTIRTCLSETAGYFSHFLVPGGVFGLTGLYVKEFERLKLNFYTFDSGPGLIGVCQQGVTSHSEEIPVLTRRLSNQLTDEKKQCLIDTAYNLLETRRSSSKVIAPDSRFESWRKKHVQLDAVVYLNYRADTAAVMRNLAFNDVASWLRGIATWAKQNHRSVVVRQHPCERDETSRGLDDYAEIMDSVDPNQDWCYFVAADDSVNSYDLMDAAKVILPWTSRVGIEAGMLGKPVLLGTNCFYANCGFADQAATHGEYFNTLNNLVENPLASCRKSDDMAALIYFVMEKCLFTETLFTPVPEDFVRWAQIAPGDLWSDPLQKDLMNALKGMCSFTATQLERQASLPLGFLSN